MKRALICTVGVGSGIERPIYKSIDDHNPDKVLLLVTSESEEKTKMIIDRYDDNLEIQIQHISDPDDLQKCYDDALSSFDELIEEGFDHSEIFLNITSGTKPMSSGLALAGVSKRCGSLSYVTGDRDENGRVKDGTERVYSMPPTLPISDSMISRAKKYFDENAYKSAFEVGDEVFQDNKSGRIGKESHYISTISKGYFEWDVFKHSKAREIFKEVDGSNMDGAQQKQFGMNISHLEKCIKEKESKPGVGEYMIIDLFANLERRIEKGEFDDSVARGYRCLEMLGQWLLWEKHGLYHADIDIDSDVFTDDERELLEMWKGENEKLSVGLRRVWKILGMLESDLSEDPIEEKGFKGILSARNTSILAHGSNPVSEETSLKFKERLKEELRNNIEDFDRKLKNGRHMELGER